MSQGQPVRTGDVYPRSAADPEKARRERDRVLTQGQMQHDGGLHVNETDVSAGKRMVTASAGGQIIAQFTVPVPENKVGEATDAVTIGEAVQAVGDKPVDLADAAALQTAEMRATGLSGNVPGGVAAAAQQAAQANSARQQQAAEEVTGLRDVLGGAAEAMPADKVVTREDADKVAAAARRNPGGEGVVGGGGGEGVVDAVEAAADMNLGRRK